MHEKIAPNMSHNNKIFYLIIRTDLTSDPGIEIYIQRHIVRFITSPEPPGSS